MGFWLPAAFCLILALSNPFRNFVDTAPLQISNAENKTGYWAINTRDRKCTSFDENEEKTWKGPFYFVQGADSQYGLISRYLLKEKEVVWEKEKELTEAIVSRVNQMDPPPRFFVICGDLCDATPPGDPLRELQEKDFKRIFGKVKKEIPVLCVCGNHDVGDTPTKESLSSYRSSFGEDFYSFLCGGLLFIVINSQFFFDGSKVKETADGHSRWLEETLGNAKRSGIKRTIIFQHIPWFLTKVDEEDHDYFTLKRDVRTLWLPKFKAAGVEAIFCGHYHRNSYGEYEGLPVVTTSAIGAQLGNDQSGARIVKVLEQSIEHRYYAIEDLPLNPL